MDGLIDRGVMGDRSEENTSRLIVSLSKLEARGIIGETSDKSGVFAHWGDADHWVNRWRKKVFQLLPFGAKFINSLREPAV